MVKFKTKILKEYLLTIFVSLVILLAISMILQIELMFRCEKNVNFNELNVENLSKFYTIEELEKKLKEHPENIIINIRLGIMYESLEKFDKANDYYKTALKLSGRSNFALYSYAMFCARRDLFLFASTLAEELNGNNKKSNFLKAKVYEQIGDNLLKQKNYLASVKSYQIVYKYAKSIGDSKYLKKIKKKYSDAYIALADEYVANNDSKEAVASLKNALEILKTPLANYKLGILLSENDMHSAEKYISKAFSVDPFIVNPYIYNSLLQKLISEAKNKGNNSYLHYYDSKLKRFKNKIAQVYLYKDQINIENSTFLRVNKKFRKTKNILYFEIKNKTNEKIDSLYIKAEIHTNGNKHSVEKKVVNSNMQLVEYESRQIDNFVLPSSIVFNDLKSNNDTFVRYFAKKTEDAPWVLIKIDFLDI